MFNFGASAKLARMNGNIGNFIQKLKNLVISV